MGKKFTHKFKKPIIISTLIATLLGTTGLAATPTAHAEEIYDGIVFRQAPEMQTYMGDFFAEMAEERCEGNYGDCVIGWQRQGLEWGWISAKAIDAYSQNNFYMTTVNPGLDEFYVFHRDSKGLDMALGEGNYTRSNVVEMYAAWVEKDIVDESHYATEWNDGTTTYDYPLYVLKYKNGEKSEKGVHILAAVQGENGEPAFASNEIIHFPVRGRGLPINNSHAVQFYIVEDTGDRYALEISYDSCIAGDYVLGTECRLMFGDDDSWMYRRYGNASLSEDDIYLDDEFTTDSENNSDNNTQNPDDNSSNNNENPEGNSGHNSDTNPENPDDNTDDDHGSNTESGQDGDPETDSGKGASATYDAAIADAHESAKSSSAPATPDTGRPAAAYAASAATQGIAAFIAASGAFMVIWYLIAKYLATRQNAKNA